MNNTIQAYPTKDFFIDMLTKDIKLERAIIDLLDNSVDGALRMRPDGDFTGLWVKLTIDDQKFVIEDNCGGFSFDTAEKYAFRFGRPIDGTNEVKNSVGRFGVGMKRALFKMGRYFEVETKSGPDHFVVKVNVDAWSQSSDWFFSHENVVAGAGYLNGEDGTHIEVLHLQKETADEFRLDTFLSGLKSEIERALGFVIYKGMSVTLNGVQLHRLELSLLEADNLKPFYYSFDVKKVNVKIYAGIGAPEPDTAGWYIYCNERLVLERDKTNLTGWEGRRYKESNIVKYHNVFAMFRGVVFFSSEDSKQLPMTTTKTGIDANSEVYKAARFHMVRGMSQVLSFLRDLESDEKREEIVVASSQRDVVALKDVVYTGAFVHPTVEPEDNVMVSVSFRALKDDVEFAKNFFGVTKTKDCGEQLFQYFLNMEGNVR